MRLLPLLLLPLLPALSPAVGPARGYSGHSVFRLQLPASVSGPVPAAALRSLAAQPGVDVWRAVRSHGDARARARARARAGADAGADADVMVSPEQRGAFLRQSRAAGMQPQLLIADVQRLIDEERAAPRASSGIDWTAYYPLGDVYQWLRSLSDKYPGVATPLLAGRSYEGRDIRGVKISYKQGNPAVFVESGIHAREWITVAVTTYMVNQLLTSQDPAVLRVAESFDWYIVPSSNPDGYEYTHRTDRMWRKTRSPGKLCDGADPNRNWDYHWMEEGASEAECDETYAGSAPFSETETRTLAAFLGELAASERLLVYLCVHSYSQLLMLPYGLNHERPDNYKQLMEIGERAVDALARRYGTQYELGTIYDIIYPASGGSMDWVKKNLTVKYTFEWELRDTGRYGFLLPAEQIIPTAEETLDSVVSILQDALRIEGL